MTFKRTCSLVLFIAAVVLVLGFKSGAVGAVKDNIDTPSSTSFFSGYLFPHFRICCGNESEQRRPAVAYNRYHDEYLVVQHQALNAGGSIGGARVGLDGDAFSHFLISELNNYDCCSNADVAYSAISDRYMVVWQQYNKSSKFWEIYGRIVYIDGPHYQDPPFLIAQASGVMLLYPKVAWNSTSVRDEFMVIWHAENATNSLLIGIGRRLVSANGGFLSTANYIISGNQQGYPDIAYNPASNRYMVVWEQAGPNQTDVYGGIVTAEGTLLSGAKPIGAGINEQWYPSIATNEQDRYLVVWQDDRLQAGDFDIIGQFFDTNANSVGSLIYFAISGENETRPALSANGLSKEYLAVYEKTTSNGKLLWANYIDEAGGFVDSFEVNSGEFGDNSFPAVGTHLAGHLIAYEWDPFQPGSTYDIYGRFWSPNAAQLPIVLNK